MSFWRVMHAVFAFALHAQILMAISAASYLAAVSRLAAGRVDSTLVLAGALAVFAIHVTDAARGLDRGDRRTQPHRCAWLAERPWLPNALAPLALLVAVVLFARAIPGRLLPGLLVGGLLVALAAIAVLYVRPLRARLGLLKPWTVSIAWVAGAWLVALLAIDPSGRDPGDASMLALRAVAWTLPLLVADSMLLDRRDLVADERAGRGTIAVRFGTRPSRIVEAALVVTGAMLAWTTLDAPLHATPALALAALCPMIDTRETREETVGVVAMAWRFGLVAF